MTSGNRLPRSTPEAQGVPSSAIMAFLEDIEQSDFGLHSLMLLRHGQVVAEGWWSPYGPQYPHMLFSLSKSFTSTAVGLAVAEGHLTIDDLVISFFPEEVPAEVDENLATMRVRHLLSMSTGHEQDTLEHVVRCEDGNWVKAFLAQLVQREPGTHFVYNNGATYMLSAILQKLTGMTVLDYLRPRLFEPLGIENPTWQSCPRGINTGGWGLSIKTQDIACFGQLYLQKGVWQGQRLVPEAWVEEATRRQVSNGDNEESDWEQGYGYQFWRCRYGIYRGDGAFGQFCIVMPKQEAVLAITSGVKDMQAVLNLVWKHLLPAMGAEALPQDVSAQAALGGKLARLALAPAQGQPLSPVAGRVSGKRFIFEPNELKLEALTFDFEEKGCRLTIRDEAGEHQVVCGSGTWLKGTSTLDSPKPRPVAASGAWTTEDTYKLNLSFYETPFCPTLTCRFAEDRLLFDFRANVGFGPTEYPQLVGWPA